MENYILTLEQAASLFDYVEKMLDETGCDHSQKHTLSWLEKNISEDQRQAILTEIEDMGGYCDCEVLMNCYEDYEEEIYGDLDDED